MSNRLYSQFKEKKTHNKTDPPPTGTRGERKALPKESTAKWGGGKGNARSDRGFGLTLIKTFLAGEYMKGNPGGKRKGKSKSIVSKMMHEVFTDEPSTVTRANVSGKRKRKMKVAIALNKARKAGAKVPYK